MSPRPVVAVDGLTVRHGAVTAVADLSFTVAPGEIVALLGPNGAGKTSAVEVIEGYRRPDAGEVRVLGLDPVADRAALAGRTGVMLQEGGVYPGIRVGEAIALFAAYHHHPLDGDELLGRVGLEAVRSSTWRQLSGGERQRLSLALALVGRPEVAFLDEPTAGVDVAGRHIVRRLVSDLRADGVAVLLTTHDLDDVERLADRVVIIDRGVVVAAGTPTELTAGAADDLRFTARPGIDRAGLGAAVGAPVSEPSPGAYVVSAAPAPALVAAVTAWLARHDLALEDLRAGRSTLEDVFLRLTEDGDR